MLAMGAPWQRPLIWSFGPANERSPLQPTIIPVSNPEYGPPLTTKSLSESTGPVVVRPGKYQRQFFCPFIFCAKRQSRTPAGQPLTAQIRSRFGSVTYPVLTSRRKKPSRKNVQRCVFDDKPAEMK